MGEKNESQMIVLKSYEKIVDCNILPIKIKGNVVFTYKVINNGSLCT